jgi:hypothetical protein
MKVLFMKELFLLICPKGAYVHGRYYEWDSG